MSVATKNAVITGANRGIGLEMCRQLANGDIYSNIYALCRKSNDELSSLARSSKQNVVVVENVEVMKDESIDVVQTAFSTTAASPVPIHLLVHNAGAYGPPEEEGRSADGMYKSQTLDNVTMERMRFAYELNTLAPLRLTKALLPNLEASQCDARKDPSKLIIISSAMGSIAENGSGGHYGYRAAKAGANMIGKNLSVDLKPKNVAVGMIHPGYVFTAFNGKDTPLKPGQHGVEESTRGVIEAIESVGMENTGSFIHGNYGEGIKPMDW